MTGPLSLSPSSSPPPSITTVADEFEKETTNTNMAITQATETWLEQRIQDGLPVDAQTPEMITYANGMASLQMATFQTPPEVSTPITKHENTWLSWLFHPVSSLWNRTQYSHNEYTSEASEASADDITLATTSEADLVIVAPMDIELVAAGWRWPWTSQPDDDRQKKINEPPLGWSRVPSEEIEIARKYARYSSAAYCLKDSTLSHWSCPPHCNNFPCLTNVTRIFSSVATGTRGYIATTAPFSTPTTRSSDSDMLDYKPLLPASPTEVIVAFRGTLNLRGFAYDLYFAHADQEIPQEFKRYFNNILTQQLGISASLFTEEEKPRIHSGFYKSMLSVSDEILEELDVLMANPTIETLTITGHSLGAALSILIAIHLMVRKPSWLSRVRLQIYTFGEPRVGNKAFVRLVNVALVANQFTVVRVTNEGDPVPLLPPNKFEFQHHPVRWLISNQGTMTSRKDSSKIDYSNSDQSDENILAKLEKLTTTEEGPELGRWWPLSDPIAHVRAWDILIGPWCASNTPPPRSPLAESNHQQM
ncbi:Alpha/Beta hydrolase protein [Syncephalis fuscata]|nr:Alpha/Beta hydrolase protein [Syncephalis fuscata]